MFLFTGEKTPASVISPIFRCIAGEYLRAYRVLDLRRTRQNRLDLQRTRIGDAPFPEVIAGQIVGQLVKIKSATQILPAISDNANGFSLLIRQAKIWYAEQSVSFDAARYFRFSVITLTIKWHPAIPRIIIPKHHPYQGALLSSFRLTSIGIGGLCFHIPGFQRS